MHINPLLDFERNSLRKQLEPRTTTDADVNDAETVVTVDELDSETEKNNEELRRIYTGHYFLSLDSAPDNPKRGYTVGKGILGNEFDLILCTKDFATKYDIKLRNPHALFSFYKENRGFYIASGSKSLSTQLTLNGHPVQQHRHALNQHSMNICFDRLEYTFKWTDHAKEYIFMQNRSQYVTDHLGGPPEVDVEMPTPLANTRTIGRWTLGQALGAGTYGRVFCAISSQGQIAAIKILDRTPDDYAVKNAEVRRCQELSEYAKEADTGGRLLRVIEVIADDHERPHYQPAFDQIAVVMEPIARETFHDLCDRGGGSCGITIETAEVFRSALLGLQDMHKGGWVHRDLKPCNIGVVGQPSRAVLLDLGTSERIPQNGSLFPEQGCVGTVNYIAPEMERRNYNHSVDIWSMGVILYCLTYNHHPWEMAENPWSPCSCQCIMPEGSLLICEKHDLMQHKFMVSYELAIDRMLGDYELARKNPIEGYIHLGGLFACMVSYDRARYNASPRSTIEEALGHPVWGLLRSNELGRMKKPRLTLDGLEVRQGPQS